MVQYRASVLTEDSIAAHLSGNFFILLRLEKLEQFSLKILDFYLESISQIQ